jgi:lactoylglutathione lyase
MLPDADSVRLAQLRKLRRGTARDRPLFVFVTIELVHDPTQGEANVSTGLSHFVIKVEAMDATISELAARGIDADVPVSPDGSDDFRTTWVIDPDGNRIELVQWPADHADGITAADWAE